jgi:hypothetical protein
VEHDDTIVPESEKKPSMVQTPNQRFEVSPVNKKTMMKLVWPQPETFGNKIKAYEVNIKAKRGNWVKSETCQMASKTIYLSHKTGNTQYFSCFVEAAELEQQLGLKKGQQI